MAIVFWAREFPAWFFFAVDSASDSTRLKTGQIIVRVDPRYFRPTEVETLLGDASRARERLGWSPRTSLAQLVDEMVKADLSAARKYALLRENGFTAFTHHDTL